jgi:hypothetical protein
MTRELPLSEVRRTAVQLSSSKPNKVCCASVVGS